MSEFSNRCKQLLAESGSNVYQIAKRSSLDRTTIQRMTTGKRLPSLDFVKDFCKHLRITPIEKAELLELYKMEKIGKTTYLNCWYIKNLIESLSSAESSCSFSADNLIPCSYPHKYNLKNSLYFTDATVYSHVKDTILSILEQELQDCEQPEILLNIPSNYIFLFHSLQSVLQQAPQSTCIKHLITLNRGTENSSNSLKNLETLSHILPIAQLLSGKYQPYYFYSTLTPNEEKLLIMPYYIITPHYLLTISSDCSSIIVHNNESVIQAYRKDFLRIFALTEPLITYTESPEKVLSFLGQTYKTFGKPSHSFEFHPCFFFMSSTFHLPEKLTERFNKTPKLFSAFREMFQPLSDMPKAPSKNFFSEEGLKIFSTTGKCFGQYKNLEEGFSADERKPMLTQYNQHNRNNEFQGYMIKPGFKTPTYINIELHDTRCLHLFSLKENFECLFIEIKESSICEAFFDFFEALPDSEFVYTKEETCKKIEDYIKTL